MSSNGEMLYRLVKAKLAIQISISGETARMVGSAEPLSLASSASCLVARL